MPNVKITPQLVETDVTTEYANLTIGLEETETLIVDDDGSGDFTTIAAAIAQAVSGEKLLVTGGADNIHNETGIIIDKSLTIQGENNPTIQADGSDRVFLIDDGDSENFVDVVIEGVTITGGKAINILDFGGGVYNAENLTLISSTISGNVANLGGGGLFSTYGTLNLINSTVSGNSAYTAAGGIFNNSGTANLTNSTISENSASYSAGGVANTNYSVLNLTNSTVSGNFAERGGGIANYAYSNLKNSVIANNGGGDIYNSFYGGSIYANGNNLVEDGSISGVITGDPNLSPLQDNGGSTQTHLPLEGSPVIDAGDNSWVEEEFDQRGSDRVVNGTVDLGAVEVQDEDPGNELPITNEPSADEQYLLELINRMRINPSEELDLLLNAGDPNVDSAISFFGVDIEELQSQWSSLTSVAPLAWSEVLKEVAIGNNDYQVSIDDTGHAPNLGQRFTDAGYNFSQAGENAFARADSVFQAHAAFAIDWGFTPTGIQDPPGHRNSIMSDSFREVGLEVREEDNPETAVGPVIVSQEFGNRSDFGSPRLLGVVYNDGAIADDDFYTPGEGISDVVITVVDQTDSSNIFTTTTWEEGGYQIELPSGSYEVTFNGDFNGDGEEDTYNDVVIIEAENVKLDVDNDVQGDENQPPTIIPEFFTINADSPVGTVVGTIEADDPDGDDLTFAIAEGNFDDDGDGIEALTIDSVTGEITVSDPDDLFEGELIELTIEVSDGELDATDFIEILINQEEISPIANDDSFSFLGVPDQLPLILDVLGNDIANDGSALEITDFPANTDQGGTLELDDQSRLIYTPNPEFTQGVDTFTYTITNESGTTDQGTVEVAFLSDTGEEEPNDSFETAIITGLTPENQEPFIASGVIGNNPNVTPEFDVDVYAFNLASSDRATIDINAESIGSTLDPVVTIFDQFGNLITFNDDELGSNTVDSQLTFTATFDGTYYAAVESWNGSSQGEYEINVDVTQIQGGRDEPNDTLNTAIFTDLSSESPGSFSFSGIIGDNPNLLEEGLDVDLFELQLDAGDSLTATIDTSELASELDSYLRLFDQNGIEVAFNDDSERGTDSLIEFTADTTGAYYLGVSGFGNGEYFPYLSGVGISGSTGEYDLELVVTDNTNENSNEPNDTIDNAIAVDLESAEEFSIPGVIGDNNNLAELGKDVDLYKVQLTQGETIAIDVDTPASSVLDLTLRVFNNSGQEIDFDGNSDAPNENFSFDPFLEFTAPTSGIYYVGISDFANDLYSAYIPESGLAAGATGIYDLHITQKTPLEEPSDEFEDPNDTQETAVTILLDEVTSGEIGDRADWITVPGLDVDIYTLNLEANQEVTIDLASTSFLDPFLRFWNAEGEQLAFNDDRSADNTDSLIEVTISETGEYFIGVSGYGNEDYDLNEDGSGSPFGSTGTYELLVTVEAQEAIIAGPEEPNDILENATNSNLTPDNLGSFKQTKAIGNNDAFSIEEAGLDVDLYAVELNENTRLTANINTNTLDSDFDSLLRIFNSEGEQLAFNDDETIDTLDSFLEFLPPAAGTYYVGVSGLGNEDYNINEAGSGNVGSIGDYEIELRLSEIIQEENPTNDTLETAIKANLANNRFTTNGVIGDSPNLEADLDFYQVDLNQNSILTIEVNGEDDLESFVRFFNSNGEEIELEYDAGDFPDPEISVTIPEDDSYFISVSAFDTNEDEVLDDSTGQYTLTLAVTPPPSDAQPPADAIRPTANDDRFQAVSNSTVIFNVLGNDTANDDQGFLEITNFPETTDKGGTLELDNQSRLVYTPDPEFGGLDTFTYTVANESGGIDQGTVEVNVNRPPDGASVQVELEVRAVPGQEDQLDDGLQIGDEFFVDVRFLDRVNDQAVRSGYADLLFDPNVLQVIANDEIDTDQITDGIIRYNEYPTTRKGTVRNEQGLVDEAGATSAALTPPSSDRVFSLHFQAIGGGSTALLASESPEQGTSAITLFDDIFFIDQKNQTNFGEINLAEAINPNNVADALAMNFANNNAISLQQGTVSGVQGIIEAMRVSIDFQDLDGNSLEEVSVGEEFKIVLSAEDLRPEGQQLGVFSVFADVIYDTVLIDVNEANLLGDFQSPVLDLPTAIAQGSGEGLVDELGGTNSNFIPVRTGTQEFAELIVTAKAQGELEVSTNAGEGATSKNTLFGVDDEVTDGTTYSQKRINIVGESVEGNADLVITEFDAVIDHVLDGETMVNLTVENIGDGSSPGFQVEILYYRADNLDALAQEEPIVVKTVAFEELAAGEEMNETIEDVSLPIEVLLAEALEDDPSIFGQQLPPEGFIESNNVDYLGVRLVSSESSGEDVAGFENNGVNGNVDDIAYFPWDFLNDGAQNVVQGGEDDLTTNQLVTQAEAGNVFNNIGQILSQGVSEADNGLDFNRIDLDLDGAISPVDAVRVVNRIGYQLNSAIIEEVAG